MYKTKKQDTVSQSSTEAEFKSFAEVGKQMRFFNNVFEFLEVPITSETVYNDNKNAINMALSSSSIHRTKHIQTKYFFINECLENQEFELRNVKR